METRNILYKSRPATVAWEMLRYSWHKTLGSFISRPCPVWYAFDKTPKNTKKEFLPIDDTWFSLHRPLYLHEHVFYNIDNALTVNPKLKGISLIFFMGLGDYLYATPLIEALAKKYPQLKLHAQVSSVLDRNNSPLVAKLLKTNPTIESVFTFEGQRNPFIWKNYIYKNALKNVPKDFLVLPVFYEYKTNTTHRVASLFKTFNLPLKDTKNIPTPIFYFPKVTSEEFNKTLKELEDKAQNKKAIIFLQLDSRASFYTYPLIDDLVKKLIAENFLVLSVTKANVQDDNFKLLDIKKFSFNENCYFLYLLKQKFPLYITSLNSVFWAASAGLGIKNLGLQHWIDPKVHNLYFPNITMMTKIKYKQVPSQKQIIVRHKDFIVHDKKIITFKPQAIIKNLKEMIAKV